MPPEASLVSPHGRSLSVCPGLYTAWPGQAADGLVDGPLLRPALPIGPLRLFAERAPGGSQAAAARASSSAANTSVA